MTDTRTDCDSAYDPMGRADMNRYVHNELYSPMKSIVAGVQIPRQGTVDLSP